jgi:hypothetical protein
MKRGIAIAVALAAIAPAGAARPEAPVIVQPQPQQLPRECRERDANPENCVVKDGPPPPPRVRKPRSVPSSVESQPPAKPDPSHPKLAPRP